MNLTGLFQYGNKNMANRNHGNTTVKESSHSSNENSVRQTVRNLSTGQTIQGEVVSKNGNEVQIMVDKDVIISARLDRDIPVTVGQNMTFEVKNPNGAHIALRPLYENLTQDVNVLKALEAAKLPVTGEWVRMVSAMMEQGMSIDKNALLDMGKLLMSNAGARPETVVMLKALNLPVTPENIQQFENYQRYEHQILQQVSDVLLEIPQTYQTMVNAGNTNVAVDFYTQILNLFTGGQGQQASTANEGMRNLVFADIAGDTQTINMDGNMQALQSGNAASDSGNGEIAGPVQRQVQTEMTQEMMQLTGESPQAHTNEFLHHIADTSSMSMVTGEIVLGMADIGSREQLAVMLGCLGMSENLLLQVREGSLAPEQLLRSLQEFLATKPEGVNHTDLMNLFGSREYNEILNRVIQQHWMMKPEDVTDKKNVAEFYGRLKAQTTQLLEALGQAAKDTPLARNLTTVQNNIDFMNQVNQAFQYIQLPLKMSGGNAHGDLYVYANRRNVQSEDGSVSALLHLDMEHLGTMDIHVRMKDKNVNTKFYLQDESMIDFIAQHIHILNERLEKRGYSMQAEMVVAEEKTGKNNVMETITAQEKKSTLLAQYSFDVRA